MKKMALPSTPTPTAFEAVLKKDLKIGSGQVLKAGTVFHPTGKKHDNSILKHYCYMRPIETAQKEG